MWFTSPGCHYLRALKCFLAPPFFPPRGPGLVPIFFHGTPILSYQPPSPPQASSSSQRKGFFPRHALRTPVSRLFFFCQFSHWISVVAYFFRLAFDPFSPFFFPFFFPAKQMESRWHSNKLPLSLHTLSLRSDSGNCSNATFSPALPAFQLSPPTKPPIDLHPSLLPLAPPCADLVKRRVDFFFPDFSYFSLEEMFYFSFCCLDFRILFQVMCLILPAALHIKVFASFHQAIQMQIKFNPLSQCPFRIVLPAAAVFLPDPRSITCPTHCFACANTETLRL